MIGSALHAQSQSDSLALANMRADIRYLASDSLHGRETATPYETLASDHIIARFKEAGVRPMGENGGFLQAFTLDADPVRGP